MHYVGFLKEGTEIAEGNFYDTLRRKEKMSLNVIQCEKLNAMDILTSNLIQTMRFWQIMTLDEVSSVPQDILQKTLKRRLSDAMMGVQ